MSTTTTSPSSTPAPRSTAALPVPPGRFGLPIIGRTLPLVQDTHAFLTRERQRYGDVFHLGFMGERGAQHAAVVFGREAQAEALADNARFPAAPGYAFSRPTLGDGLLMSDGARHLAQRRLIQPAFHSTLYSAYLARLEEALLTVLATWSDGSSGHARSTPSDQRAFYRSFYRDAEAIMFRLACRIILGANDEEPPREYVRTLAKWEILQGGVTNPIHTEWFWPWRRVMGAARWLDRQTIARLREGRADPSSVLGILAAERDRRAAQGEAADPEAEDTRIAQHLRLLVFAAYGTTAGAASRALLEVLRRPEWGERVQAELHTDRVGAPVTLADLDDTPETDLFLREVLRLYPEQHLIVRGCAQDWQVHGHTVPAGWLVILPAVLTHRDPEAFPDPDAFDPDRFRDPAPEVAERQRRALAIFGQGAHTCPGRNLAPLEVKAILTRVLRDFDVALAPQDLEASVYVPAGRPADGARVLVRRRATEGHLEVA